jgi:ribosomal protein S18 acetylase RimI-like enzyme
MISIRPMTVADVPLGMYLKTQVGWNQTEADWRRALALEPEGCFVAQWDGKPVGTTTTCIFGSVAWVAMVLVEESMRSRGIGQALMRHALAFLDGKGVPSVRLDATPLGQPLYEKLGFVVQFQLARFGGRLPHARPVTEVDSARREAWDELLSLDRDVTRTDRRKLLEPVFAEEPKAVRCVRHAGKLMGFMTARRGTRAIQVGPCLAEDEAGLRLLQDACHRYAGQNAFLDVPAGNEPATAFVKKMGLTTQRPLTRMCRGLLIEERIDALWTCYGPEKG